MATKKKPPARPRLWTTISENPKYDVRFDPIDKCALLRYTDGLGFDETWHVNMEAFDNMVAAVYALQAKDKASEN